MLELFLSLKNNSMLLGEHRTPSGKMKREGEMKKCRIILDYRGEFQFLPECQMLEELVRT